MEASAALEEQRSLGGWCSETIFERRGKLQMLWTNPQLSSNLSYQFYADLRVTSTSIERLYPESQKARADGSVDIPSISLAYLKYYSTTPD
jgi:hypothetical protein